MVKNEKTIWFALQELWKITTFHVRLPEGFHHRKSRIRGTPGFYPLQLSQRVSDGSVLWLGWCSPNMVGVWDGFWLDNFHMEKNCSLGHLPELTRHSPNRHPNKYWLVSSYSYHGLVDNHCSFHHFTMCFSILYHILPQFSQSWGS